MTTRQPHGDAGRQPVWRRDAERRDRQRIFREELDEFLPERILDFHVHVMNRGVTPKGQPYNCAGNRLGRFDLNDLGRALADSYPGRQTSAVVFGFPSNDYDMARNNRYVAEACDRKRFFPFRLFDPNERDHGAVVPPKTPRKSKLLSVNQLREAAHAEA